MKVRELINELQKYNPEFDVHVDVHNDEDGWEGDRVVRHVAEVTPQLGYDAVAIKGTPPPGVGGRMI